MQSRFDFGLGNPNEAAVLIVAIGGLMWHCLIARRGGQFLAAVVAILVALAVWPTYSRTGFVAYTIGFSASYLWAGDQSSRSRWLGLTIVVACGALMASSPRMRSRIVVSPTEDGSLLSRASMWTAASHMIADNHSGWGTGRAGAAYTEWYQDIRDTRTYRTLVSGHLTKLAELGWIGGAGYIALWSLLLWLGEWRRISPALNGCSFALATYYVAGFANHVFDNWLSIVAVVLVAATAAAVRWRTRCWPAQRWLWVGIGMQVVALTAWISLSTWTADTPVRVVSGFVYYGTSARDVLVLGDASVLGTEPGRAIRAYPDCTEGYRFVMGMNTWVESLDYDTVVVAGRIDQAVFAQVIAHRAKIGRLIFINPESIDFDLVPPELDAKVNLYVGEFASPNCFPARWRRRVLPGIERYVDTWPGLVLAGR